MPPSPSVRISPRRELRAENHKRGRSLESGIFYKEKEDDLALFKEVQNKESESFLLQSNDDLDDIFSTKFRNFSIPTRVENSDLLNAEGDKNDYDWLITPPETPLFPSLDEVAPPVNLERRGRPRSQPVSISRSPSMEKGYRNGRSSASPHRLSPSPQSGNTTLQSRSRPVSATHSSPPPKMRYPSPSRGLSPPPSKTSTSPLPRSSTPPPRRMSTGSRVRGTSPIKTSRGNSSSPKLKEWQSNVPGFSSEAPPNLRTSLADRPASYVRGSSPASRNGRRSMSPTASRSVGSSRNHDRDPFSSHSKGSVASSRDDDVDSLQSVPFSSSERSAPRSISAYPGSRHISSSKKSTNVLSSSAPKRSLDLVLQETDRKGPHNMFRPLLSSVPSSFVGKTSADYRSSVTTSSNASSDQGTSGAHNAEEIESLKGHYPALNDELFVMDQAVALNEDFESKILEDSLVSQHSEIDNPSLDRKREYSDADGTSDMVICSKCSLGLNPTGLIKEESVQFCQECKDLEVNSTITNLQKLIVGENTKVEFENGLLEVLDQSTSIQESLQVNKIANVSQNSYSDLTFASEEEINELESKVDAPEGAGISLLLKRSNSNKGNIVKCRSFTASNTSYDEFSYTRDSLNSMRSSIEHSSSSLLSSLDLGFCRQRCREDNFEVIAANMDKDEESMCNDIESNMIFETASETSSHLLNVVSGDISVNCEKFADDERLDVTEVPNPSSLHAVSEMEIIENADVGSADSLYDDDSNNSNSCMDELQHNDVMTATVEEFDVSGPQHGVVEESRIMLEDTGGTKARILTLDEATDAILFCSSLVHNLAYEAANIAIDNETSQVEVLQPKITFTVKSSSDGRDIRSRTTGKCSSKAQEAREKKLEIDTKPVSINDETEEKFSPRIVEDSNKGDSLKLPTLEAKCNCIIM